jgi:Isy1-like splicing family
LPCIDIDGVAMHRRLRDLNDEINKLIREKGHWERRIVELGGPDYAKSAPKVTVRPWQGFEGKPHLCTQALEQSM